MRGSPSRVRSSLLLAALLIAGAGCEGGAPRSESGSLSSLAAPGTLSAESGDGSCTVQWTALRGALSYNLYWSEVPPVTKASGTMVRGAVSPFTHKNLVNGRSYYYVVTAVYPQGESPESAQVSAMPRAPVPGKPSAVGAVPGDRQVLVEWAAVARADTYTLYWSKAAGVVPGGGGVTAVTGLTGTTYTHSGLVNGDAYYYVVTAVNTGGEGLPSVEATATPQPPAPGAPANLAATAKDGENGLAWSPVAAATSYNLYWSLSAGVFPGGAGVTSVSGILGTTYLHTGLVNGTTYHYVVTAMGPGGESAPSGEVSARPLPPAPPAPLGVTAIVKREENAQSIAIQWFDVPGATGYNLYRGTSPGLAVYYLDPARATKFADVTAPYYDEEGIAAGTTYYYVVTAFVPLVEGAPSAEVSALIRGGSGGSGETGGDHGPPDGKGPPAGRGPSGENGGETGFGNNLSFPVVFADGFGVGGARITGAWVGPGPLMPPLALDFAAGLRPLSDESIPQLPYYDASTRVSLGGIGYFPQGTASTWQAEWRSNVAGAEIPVVIDWGDALTSRRYTSSSVIRIEATLLQDETVPGVSDTMLAYAMKWLSGYRDTEMQGTDGTTYASAARTVFTVHARLTIEKVTGTGVDLVVFDKATHESFESTEGESGHEGESGGSGGYGGGGPGGAGSGGGGHEGGGGGPPQKFGAELNVGGRLVYGTNFMLRRVTLPPLVATAGQWRITVSLDPVATVGASTITNRVRIVGTKDAKAEVAADGLSSTMVLEVN